MELQGLVRRAVLEVELAARVPKQARVLRAAAEERGDEGCCVADARRVAGRSRIERTVRHRAGEIAAELALDAGVHMATVLPGRVTGARTLSRQCQEGALVLAGHAEGAVLVLLDTPLARARIRRPFDSARAVVVDHDERRKAVVAELLAFALATRIGEAGCGEHQDAGDEQKRYDDATHL